MKLSFDLPPSARVIALDHGRKLNSLRRTELSRWFGLVSKVSVLITEEDEVFSLSELPVILRDLKNRKGLCVYDAEAGPMRISALIPCRKMKKDELV
jgi:hypothetical protein